MLKKSKRKSNKESLLKFPLKTIILALDSMKLKILKMNLKKNLKMNLN
jgi:hypothetical protein